MALVSVRLPLPSPPFLYSFKGHIYCGRISYVSSPNTREPITQLPPSNHSNLCRCVVFPWVKTSLILIHNSVHRARVGFLIPLLTITHATSEHTCTRSWKAVRSGCDFRPRFDPFNSQFPIQPLSMTINVLAGTTTSGRLIPTPRLTPSQSQPTF